MIKILIVAGVGCLVAAILLFVFRRPAPSQNTPPIHPSSETRPGHPEIVKMLQERAKEKRVYWQVWCTAFYAGDEEKWQGIATKGELLNIYAEDGAQPYWSTGSHNTQDEAAYALAQLLTREPNHEPQYKDRRSRAMCPEPLIGSPGAVLQPAH